MDRGSGSETGQDRDSWKGEGATQLSCADSSSVSDVSAHITKLILLPTALAIALALAHHLSFCYFVTVFFFLL